MLATAGTLVLIVFTFVSFCAPSAVNAQQQNQPNIVFILADDMGIGDVGAYHQNKRAELGLPSISTPSIDSLASNGMRFTDMHSCPMCSASRSTIHNGFHQGHGKVDRNVSKNNPIQPGCYEKTFAQLLQDSGYRTGIFGAWNIHGFNVQTGAIDDVNSSPFGKGYDTLWCNAVGNGYRANFAVIDNDNQNGIFDNSDLILVPRPFATDPNDLWAIQNGGLGTALEYGMTTTTNEAIAFLDEVINNHSKFLLTFTIFGVHSDTNLVPNQGIYESLAGISDQDKNYAASVGQVDAAVGRLLDKLNDPNGDGNQDDSVMDNTIVVFTSDNGNQSASHNIETFESTTYYVESTDSFVDLRGEKYYSLEGGTKSPFIVQWQGNPAIVSGSIFGGMSTFADWLPTVADMLNVEPPLGIDGYSFWDDLNNGVSVRPDFRIATSTSSNNGDWAIAIGGYKLHVNQSDKTLELFHLPSNPEESLNDQIVDRPDILNSLMNLGLAEGVESDSSILRNGNDYFVQFKTWVGNDDNFNSSSNWTGGIANVQLTTGAAAINHLTGPAANWICTLGNDSNKERIVRIAETTHVLATEISSENSGFTLLIDPQVSFESRNELRIQNGGHLALDDAQVKSIRKVKIYPNGKLSGHGSFVGDPDVLVGVPEFQQQGFLDICLINDGNISPGRDESLAGTAVGNNSSNIDLDSTGVMYVEGDFIQKEGGILTLEIGGTDNSNSFDAEYDQIVVSGNATISGSMNVSFVDSFLPKPGDNIELLTAGQALNGQIAQVNVNGLPSDLKHSIEYSSNSVRLEFSKTPLIGDVNLDGVVNLLDVSPFVELLTNGMFQVEADTNFDGEINILDIAGFIAILQN